MKYKRNGNVLIPKTFKQTRKRNPWFITSVYVGILILFSFLLIIPLISIMLGKL